MKTTLDFKQVVEERKLTHYDVNDCSICGVYYGYKFNRGDVYFNSSCGCASSYPRISSYQEIADDYNRQSHPQIIEKMNAFWGFKNELL